MRITVAILTVSDRCSRGEATDTSGPAISTICMEQLAAKVTTRDCVADDREVIASRLRSWAKVDPHPDLILTTGGTGLTPRDVTPEATLDVLERRHSGLMELVRLRGSESTPYAFLSRGEAGTIGRTLVINLPGSERGAVESLRALLDVIPHAIAMLRGEAASHPGIGSEAVHHDS